MLQMRLKGSGCVCCFRRMLCFWASWGFAGLGRVWVGSGHGISLGPFSFGCCVGLSFPRGHGLYPFLFFSFMLLGLKTSEPWGCLRIFLLFFLLFFLCGHWDIFEH